MSNVGTDFNFLSSGIDESFHKLYIKDRAGRLFFLFFQVYVMFYLTIIEKAML